MARDHQAVLAEALLKTDDVAALLQVQPSTIRKWVHMQSIPVVRVGRAVRFRRDEIARWVGEHSKSEMTWD